MLTLKGRCPRTAFSWHTNACTFLLVALSMRLKVPLEQFFNHLFWVSVRAKLTKECF